jgi:ketosteroid isomerase-like protein
MGTSGDAVELQTSDPGRMTDTTPSNIQLVQDTYATFGRGDIEAVTAAMHPDIEWHEAEHSPWHAPGGHHGPTEVLTNVFARIPHHFDGFEVHPTTFHDAGETVIVEGRYRASAASISDPLDAQVCHVWTVRDGKLAGFQQYTDTWQFAQATSTST